MITDRLPRQAALKQEYLRSDSIRTVELSLIEPLCGYARQMETALARESRREVQLASNALTTAVATAFRVPAPPVKVLGARPRHVTESSAYETFGDYDPTTTQIRLWMRTAVRQQATSFGTLLSTLCHEICHHLDVALLGFPNTYHTRGFYERAALLYHHARGTPVRRLVWVEQANGRFRIDWGRTMNSASRSGSSNRL